MQPPNLREILDFAVDAAHAAGALTLGYFNVGTPHEIKSDSSPVTVADRNAERLLREHIAAAFPRHGILGEEFGEERGAEPARWILDPIDGTFSFIHGVPLYSVLIGFEWRGEVLAGVIHLPALNETVYAARGLGCYCNGRRARVSDVTTLDRATLLTGGGKMFDKTSRGPAFEQLRRACLNHRSWCDGYAYALVATGRAEIVLDPKMAIWDCAALLPCLLEAGGTFTDWTGRTTHDAAESIATTPALLPAVLRAIA
ncbi:MAG: inositol monophosphatase family protein [Phycisphaerae bacterium]